MRNQLKPVASSMEGCAYSSSGDLDGHDAHLYAYAHGTTIIGIGAASFSLSGEAAAELAKHLIAALDHIEGKQTSALLELFTAASKQEQADVMRVLDAYQTRRQQQEVPAHE